MFTFVGVDSAEAVEWFDGHDVRRLPDGNISYFVNTDFGSPETSKIAVFKMDEENLIAELVWLYEPVSPVMSMAMGNGQLLPNGNWFIGWGFASFMGYQICSEITADKDTVMDLYSTPGVSSYRAYRFELNADEPAAVAEEIDVAPGEWVFNWEDTTGITIDIESMTTGGYNKMTVSRYNYAPVKPTFPGKDPVAYPVRVVVEATAISAIAGDIIFDVDEFGITNPEEITIFHREFPGQGLFIPLTTSYNNVTGEISAAFDKFGEFIITYPDVPSIAFAPNPVYPVDEANVNQEYPVRLEWSPRGFVEDFALQIARDMDFTDLVVDETGLKSSIYDFADPDDNTTYYWRAMTSNDAGDSEWSDTVSFHAGAPSVELSVPNGGEEWQVGLNYFILWEDNIPEDVILELHKADALLEVIGTVPSNKGYRWRVPTALEPGDDYKVLIRSMDDEALMDISEFAFSMIDTVSGIGGTSYLEQNLVIYPNPTENELNIQYQLADYENVTIRIYDITGRLLNTVSEGYQVPGEHQMQLNLQPLEGNLFIIQLQAGKGVVHKKVCVIK